MMNSSCKKRLLIALRKAPLWTINHYFFLHSKCGNAWIKVVIKKSRPYQRDEIVIRVTTQFYVRIAPEHLIRYAGCCLDTLSL